MASCLSLQDHLGKFYITLLPSDIILATGPNKQCGQKKQKIGKLNPAKDPTKLQI